MQLDEIFPFDLSDQEKGEFFGDLNKNIADLVFDILKLNKFTPYDIKYDDTYFIMRGNPNSVIHFRIKEVWKNWRFGMWVHSDNLFATDLNSYSDYYYKDSSELPVVELFCQHEHLIDKFKPTASTFEESIDVYDFKHFLKDGEPRHFSWYKIESMLNWIKDHPILAYDDISPNWYRGKYSIKRFIKTEYEEYSKLHKENIYARLFVPYAERKINQFRKSDIVKDAGVLYIGKGFISNPRIDVDVEFKEDADHDKVDKLVHKLLPFKTKDIGKIDPWTYTLRFNFYQGEDRIMYDY